MILKAEAHSQEELNEYLKSLPVDKKEPEVMAWELAMVIDDISKGNFTK